MALINGIFESIDGSGLCLARVGPIISSNLLGGVMGMVGTYQASEITLSYHRCLSHRVFQFKHRWFERLYATIGALSLQMGPIWWCSIHRLHHQYSDTAKDSHNSQNGLLYSHVLWFGHLDPRWRGVIRLKNFKIMCPISPKIPAMSGLFFKWWEFDLTYLVIKILEKLKLIENVKYPLETKVRKTQILSNPQPVKN